MKISLTRWITKYKTKKYWNYYVSRLRPEIFISKSWELISGIQVYETGRRESVSNNAGARETHHFLAIFQIFSSDWDVLMTHFFRPFVIPSVEQSFFQFVNINTDLPHGVLQGDSLCTAIFQTFSIKSMGKCMGEAVDGVCF